MTFSAYSRDDYGPPAYRHWRKTAFQRDFDHEFGQDAAKTVIHQAESYLDGLPPSPQVAAARALLAGAEGQPITVAAAIALVSEAAMAIAADPLALGAPPINFSNDNYGRSDAGYDPNVTASGTYTSTPYSADYGARDTQANQRYFYSQINQAAWNTWVKETKPFDIQDAHGQVVQYNRESIQHAIQESHNFFSLEEAPLGKYSASSKIAGEKFAKDHEGQDIGLGKEQSEAFMKHYKRDKNGHSPVDADVQELAKVNPEFKEHVEKASDPTLSPDERKQHAVAACEIHAGAIQEKIGAGGLVNANLKLSIDELCAHEAGVQENFVNPNYYHAPGTQNSATPTSTHSADLHGLRSENAAGAVQQIAASSASAAPKPSADILQTGTQTVTPVVSHAAVQQGPH